MTLPPSSSVMRVLVVDDDPAVRTVMKSILLRTGLKVDVAKDGADALHTIAMAEAPIDLVVLDLTMPGMDGRATIMEIERRNPGLPIMLCSGSVGELARAEDESTGAVVGWISKPFCLLDFVQKVRTALE